MIGALVIVFREVIEAGLIVGIVLAATRGVAGRGRWVSTGVLAGLLGAGVVALFAGAISDSFAGSGQEILVRSQNDPAEIALDVSNGHMYWANYGGGDIRRANLDGTGQATLIRGRNGPAFITLDLSVLPPLNIEAVTKSDNGFTLNWNALMGRAYQVQFKTDLAQPTWINLVLRLTATNATMTASDSVVTDPQRFYRVLLLP